jgi:hypothetical protein
MKRQLHWTLVLQPPQLRQYVAAGYATEDRVECRLTVQPSLWRQQDGMGANIAENAFDTVAAAENVPAAVAPTLFRRASVPVVVPPWLAVHPARACANRVVARCRGGALDYGVSDESRCCGAHRLHGVPAAPIRVHRHCFVPVGSCCCAAGCVCPGCDCGCGSFVAALSAPAPPSGSEGGAGFVIAILPVCDAAVDVRPCSAERAGSVSSFGLPSAIAHAQRSLWLRQKDKQRTRPPLMGQ